MATLIVDSEVVAAIPSLRGIPSEEIDRALEDAGRIRAIVHDRRLLFEHDLRVELETAGIGPDRTNRALDVLRALDHIRLVPLGDLATRALERPDENERGKSLHELSLSDLRQLSSMMEIPGRSKLSRDELVVEIRRHQGLPASPESGEVLSKGQGNTP